ncbi:MAG TPA: DUF99 family protein [Thermoanaerobaculia bacterium]|nr:DUF99 family protein [Thermoanaerobaculia bacterium]
MPSLRRFSHVVAYDDCAFDRETRGDVGLVGAVFAGARLDGVLSGRVRRDGANSASVMARMIFESRFAAHLQLIMLQGIAVAGFNVVDVFELHAVTDLPILVVARREPDLKAIRDTLTLRIRGGARKWQIIERLGAMDRVRGVWVQTVGLTDDETDAILERHAVNGNYPEPLRVAHLIASGLPSS